MRFANIFRRILASMFNSDIGLKFSFFVVSLSGFWIRMMLASLKEFGSLPSSFIFWSSLRRIGVNSFLNIFYCPGKPSGPRILYAGIFLITALVSVAVIGLFRFSPPSSFRFGRLYFSKNLSISPLLPNFLAQSCSQKFLTILCISVVSVVISPLSFLILFIWILSLFFLMSLKAC